MRKTLPQFTEELKRRFWSNVQIGDDAQCWEWNGHVMNHGYGVMKIHQVGYLAHRIALFLSVGINEHNSRRTASAITTRKIWTHI